MISRRSTTRLLVLSVALIICPAMLHAASERFAKVHELYGSEFRISLKEAQSLHEKAEELYRQGAYPRL